MEGLQAELECLGRQEASMCGSEEACRRLIEFCSGREEPLARKKKAKKKHKLPTPRVMLRKPSKGDANAGQSVWKGAVPKGDKEALKVSKRIERELRAEAERGACVVKSMLVGPAESRSEFRAALHKIERIEREIVHETLKEGVVAWAMEGVALCLRELESLLVFKVPEVREAAECILRGEPFKRECVDLVLKVWKRRQVQAILKEKRQQGFFHALASFMSILKEVTAPGYVMSHDMFLRLSSYSTMQHPGALRIVTINAGEVKGTFVDVYDPLVRTKSAKWPIFEGFWTMAILDARCGREDLADTVSRLGQALKLSSCRSGERTLLMLLHCAEVDKATLEALEAKFRRRLKKIGVERIAGKPSPKDAQRIVESFSQDELEKNLALNGV